MVRSPDARAWVALVRLGDEQEARAARLIDLIENGEDPERLPSEKDLEQEKPPKRNYGAPRKRPS